MICPNCNIDHGPGKKFCRKCGSALVEFAPDSASSSAESNIEAGKVCAQCGINYSSQAQFCKKCGSPLTEKDNAKADVGGAEEDENISEAAVPPQIAEEVPSISGADKTCVTCGLDYSSDKKFCRKCGGKLNDKQAANALINEPVIIAADNTKEPEINNEPGPKEAVKSEPTNPCTACGTENQPSAKFCRNCGSAPLKKQEMNAKSSGAQGHDNGKACSECGIDYPSTATFCRKCGKKLFQKDDVSVVDSDFSKVTDSAIISANRTINISAEDPTEYEKTTSGSPSSAQAVVITQSDDLIEVTAQGEHEPIKLCGHCGQELPLVARFCRECGMPLGEKGESALAGTESPVFNKNDVQSTLPSVTEVFSIKEPPAPKQDVLNEEDSPANKNIDDGPNNKDIVGDEPALIKDEIESEGAVSKLTSRRFGWRFVIIAAVVAIVSFAVGYKIIAKVKEKKTGKPASAMVSIKTEPDAASLTVDGRDYGISPQIITDLVPGDHIFTASKVGYVSKTQTVKLAGGEMKEIFLSLSLQEKTTSSAASQKPKQQKTVPREKEDRTVPHPQTVFREPVQPAPKARGTNEQAEPLPRKSDSTGHATPKWRAREEKNAPEKREESPWHKKSSVTGVISDPLGANK